MAKRPDGTSLTAIMANTKAITMGVALLRAYGPRLAMAAGRKAGQAHGKVPAATRGKKAHIRP